MFQFNFIQLQKEMVHHRVTTLILKKMNLFSKKKTLFAEKNGYLLIAEGADNGIIGAACLFEKNIEDVNADIKELLPSFILSRGYIWECSHIYFHISCKQSPFHALGRERLTQRFYRDLYETFVKFDQTQEVGFMIVRLSLDSFFATEQYGWWPYVVNLKDSFLVHNILPLKGEQYTAYQEKWKKLDESLQQV